MNRRSFLIGSGSILTSSFVAHAEKIWANSQSVVPLLSKKCAKSILYFMKFGSGHSKYQLYLDSLTDDLPLLTHREVLQQMWGYRLPEKGQTPLSVYRKVYNDFDISPRRVDDYADYWEYEPMWMHKHSASSKAHVYLKGLDLFSAEKPDQMRGDLCFIENNVSGFRGVNSTDPITASLLQARLLELNQNVYIEIVD